MIIPMMVGVNCFALVVILRYSGFWKIIQELNNAPKYAPILLCAIVQMVFIIIFLILVDLR